MGVYDRQIATALRLIAKKGQAVTWVKHNAQQGNIQPWKTSKVPSGYGVGGYGAGGYGVGNSDAPSYAVSIVFLAPKSGLQALFALMQGTSIPTGAPVGLMGAVTGFTPEINDMVMRGPKAMVIKDFDIVAPNGEVILYKLEFE
jgi:hypothetical protein